MRRDFEENDKQLGTGKISFAVVILVQMNCSSAGTWVSKHLSGCVDRQDPAVDLDER